MSSSGGSSNGDATKLASFNLTVIDLGKDGLYDYERGDTPATVFGPCSACQKNKGNGGDQCECSDQFQILVGKRIVKNATFPRALKSNRVLRILNKNGESVQYVLKDTRSQLDKKRRVSMVVRSPLLSNHNEVRSPSTSTGQRGRFGSVRSPTNPRANVNVSFPSVSSTLSDVSSQISGMTLSDSARQHSSGLAERARSSFTEDERPTLDRPASSSVTRKGKLTLNVAGASSKQPGLFTSPNRLQRKGEASGAGPDLMEDSEQSASESESKLGRRRRYDTTAELDVAFDAKADPSCTYQGGRSPFVFLGGSCDPTTWRQDVAIPLLEKMHVPYYNPQRVDWQSSRIQVEHYAKQSSTCVLFVIDSRTRAIASLLEAVEYIMSDRRVVLVIKELPENTEIAGHKCNQRELADLNRARQFLADVASRHSERCDIFADVEKAIMFLGQLHKQQRRR